MTMQVQHTLLSCLKTPKRHTRELESTYYLRRKFQPEKTTNWKVNISGIMEAFFYKKSAKEQGTIMAIKRDNKLTANNT